MDIEKIDFKKELTNMDVPQMQELSEEIRKFLVEKVSATGGHLASNLGVVELTIALHKVFNLDEDAIVWDVGHQTYVHKILTGRADKFDTLRQMNGISGFTRNEESEYDLFDTGHSSVSLSLAQGIAEGRRLQNKEGAVIAVIGDGALTGGVAYEAINSIGDRKSKVIMILNDNEMSISPNSSGISSHLNDIRESKGYFAFKNKVKQFCEKVPLIGKGIAKFLINTRRLLKYTMLDGIIFEELGMKYYGPIDGHDIPALINILEKSKLIEGPLCIHVKTQKGRGYKPAEEEPDKFHSVPTFDADEPSKTLITKTRYQDVFGKALIEKARADSRIVAISAAMIDGTGLTEFQRMYPIRCIDAGIAEQHAVSLAAGLAKSGMKPVVCIYSTFLQRAYDNIIEEVFLQGLPVVFAIDRAGIVGGDGTTHQGLLDISYLGSIPGMELLAPCCDIELEEMLEYALSKDSPVAIRYPRGEAFQGKEDSIYASVKSGVTSMKMFVEGRDACILAAGNMVQEALNAAVSLKNEGIDVAVVNVGRIWPFPISAVKKIAEEYPAVITIEEGVYNGSFGEYAKSISGKVTAMTYPTKFIEHGGVNEIRTKYGMDAQGIVNTVKNAIGE